MPIAKWKIETKDKVCQCGCSNLVGFRKDNGLPAKYIHGHNYRGKFDTEETKKKKSLALKGRKITWKDKLVFFSKGHIPWNKNKKECFSEETIEKMRLRTGHLNNHWRGGITPYYRVMRNSFKYKDWRRMIYRRDEWTCQNNNCSFCSNKRSNKNIVAHHIKPFAYFPELRFDVNNGITYCRDYHLKTELHKNMKVI